MAEALRTSRRRSHRDARGRNKGRRPALATTNRRQDQNSDKADGVRVGCDCAYEKRSRISRVHDITFFVGACCHQAFIERTHARIPCSLMELPQGVMLGFDVPLLVARASELSPRT